MDFEYVFVFSQNGYGKGVGAGSLNFALDFGIFFAFILGPSSFLLINYPILCQELVQCTILLKHMALQVNSVDKVQNFHNDIF